MPISPFETLDIPELEIMEMPARLDSDSALQVEEDTLLCIQSGAREMLMDCTNMDYLTAAGTQTLLRLAREMQSVGGKFAVCNLSPQAQQMFEMCGLDAIIPVYENESAARFAMAA